MKSSSRLLGQWVYLRSQPGFQKTPLRVLFRLLCWRLICPLGGGKTVHLRARNLNLYLPAEWHGAGKLIYIFRDDYETELGLLNKFLSPGQVMIDVGANYGMFSLTASQLVGNGGKVIAFEPARSTFSVFERNLALNGVQNVTPFRLALSEAPGKLRLYHDVDTTRNSLAASADTQDFEEVEVRTLDDVVKELGVSQLAFLKIDVEGADELVCRGAVQILQTSLPPVLFEHNPDAAARMGLGSSTGRTLARLGYHFYHFDGSSLSRIDAEELPGGNIVALHPESSASSAIFHR